MVTRKKTAKRKAEKKPKTTKSMMSETITFATRFDSMAEKRLVAENRALRSMVVTLHLECINYRIELGILKEEKALDEPDMWTIGGASVKTGGKGNG